MSKRKDQEPPEGYRWVYARYIRVKGKLLYPKKAKFFKFLVKD